MYARWLGAFIALVGCGIAGCGWLATAAQADPNGQFGCFSAPSIVVSGGNQSAPLTANPNGWPCQNQSGNDTAAQASGAAGTSSFVQGTVAATNTLESTPQDGDYASATTAAKHVVVSASGTVIEAELLGSTATVTCSGGTPVFSGSASVSSVTINGTPVTLTGPNQQVSTPAGTLYIDDRYSPDSTVTYYRALWLQTSSGDVISGEAAAAYMGAPCQLAPPKPPPPPPPAPTQQWGCRAIGAEIGSQQLASANPLVIPCHTENTSVAGFNLIGTFPLDLGIFGWTTVSPDPMPAAPAPDGAQVQAEAGVGKFSIGTGANEVDAFGVTSYASATCQGGKLNLYGISVTHALYIGGQPKQINSSPATFPLPNGATVYVNYNFTGPGWAPYAIDHRAIWIQNLDGTDVILGDAIAGVDQPKNPC
jgi:hypothetical protein